MVSYTDRYKPSLITSKRVYGTANPGRSTIEDMSVNHSRLNVFMTQEFLYRSNIVTTFQEVSRERMPGGAPHNRHTYATQYYKQTKDIETLRRILGHSDISTTTIYITLANIDVENGMKSFKGFI